MVIHYLDIFRMSLNPAKADTELIVDADAILPRTNHASARLPSAAILDRLLHHAITLNIRGNSYRLKDKLKAGLIRTEEPDTVS